jgi:hypothetical protein
MAQKQQKLSNKNGFELQLMYMLHANVAHRVSVVLFSFIFFTLLFLLIYSRPTSERVRRNAGVKKVGVRTYRAQLATKLVSFIHASIVSLGSISLLSSRNELKLWDKLFEPFWPVYNGNEDEVIFYACVSTGYFIADFILCVVQVEEHGVAYVLHAIASLCAGVFWLVNDEGVLYVLLLLLFELSTPFLNIRWLLSEYGYENSPLYLVNGLAFVLSFVFSRVILGVPLLMKLMYEMNSAPVKDRHHILTRLVFTVMPFCMIFLNIYWGFKVIKGFLKAAGFIKSNEKGKSE